MPTSTDMKLIKIPTDTMSQPYLVPGNVASYILELEARLGEQHTEVRDNVVYRKQ